MKRLVLVGIAACFALTACNLDPRTATLPGGVATGDDGYTVTATFASADNLVPNSEVQYQNVRIGTVTSISLNHATWQATVKLRLLKSTDLPADAEASVGQKSLLGAELVQITTPTRSLTSARLSDDPVIPLSRTGEYPETEDVLSAVSLLLNDGGLAQIKTITSEVNKALSGRTGTARDLLVQLSRFIGSLNEQKQQLIQATEALNRLAGELADNRDTVANALTHITPAVTTLNKQRPQLTTALAAMSHLGVVATQVIAASRNGLETNLALLRPTLTKLAEAGSNIPESLPLFVSFPFPITTLFKAVKGDYMNLFETLDLSVSSIKRDFLQQIPVVGSSQDDTVREANNPLTAPLGPAVPKTGTTKPSQPKTAPSRTHVPAPTHSASPSSAPSSCSLLGTVLGSC
jgi:phospholipid/cholesterol/gamma-HCH transport system substrate-binding protein